MRDYELTILLRPELLEKELVKIIKELSAALEKAGAKISRRDDLVKKALAYEIEKCCEAHCLYFELELSPEAVLGIDKKLRMTENVIRHLLIKTQNSNLKSQKQSQN